MYYFVEYPEECSGRVRIGGRIANQCVSEYEWVSSTGTTEVIFTAFSPDTPNDCIEMRADNVPDASGLWNKHNCYDKLCFLCEIPY